MPGNAKLLTLQYPELGTGPVSAEPYYDPEIFDQEVEKVFRKSWIFAGELQEVANPGQFFVRKFPFAKTSVLVVRGQDGELRAFHNVCTHRGNKLEWKEGGKCKGFACNFHGWTFDTQGELIRATAEEDYLDGFDKSKLGLPPVHVSTWGNFVFINLDEHPAQTLREFLGEWGEETEAFPWANFPCYTRYTAEVNANWKIVMDAFLETFHFGHLHKRTVASAFTTAEHPLGKMHAAQCLGVHGRLSTPGINPDFMPTPVMAEALNLAGREVGEGDAAAGPRVGDLAAGVNPSNVEDWVTDMNMVFPNLMIQVFDNLYLSYSFMPVSFEKTVLELRYHHAAPKTAHDAFGVEVQACDFRDIFLEDLGTNEKTQEALNARVIKEFHLHDWELMVRHWHITLGRMLAE